MNIFENAAKAEQFETLTDDPEGARVILECGKCGIDVHEAKYHRKTKLLSWKCPECGYISKYEGFEMRE